MNKKCKIKIAGFIFEVEYLFDEFTDFAKDYLWTESQEADYSVKVTDKLLHEELKNAQKTAEYEGKERFEISEVYFERACVCRMISECLIERGILLMHGLALSMDSKAVIFTAKSGTGKTTHARMWKELFSHSDRVKVINGDKPFVEISDAEVKVYGSPWCGKEGENINTNATLKAICILQRSTKNEIKEISFEEALPKLLQQFHRPKDLVKLQMTLEIVGKLENQIRFYVLNCLPNVEAARLSFESIFETI